MNAQQKDELWNALADYADAVDDVRSILRKLSADSGVDITLRDIQNEVSDYGLLDADAVEQLFTTEAA